MVADEGATCLVLVALDTDYLVEGGRKFVEKFF